MTPKYYTTYEGDYWFPWPKNKSLSTKDLTHPNVLSRIWRKGILIHSILFKDGTRWDAITGWNIAKVKLP